MFPRQTSWKRPAMGENMDIGPIKDGEMIQWHLKRLGKELGRNKASVDQDIICKLGRTGGD